MKTPADNFPSADNPISAQDVYQSDLNPVEDALEYNIGPDSRNEKLSNNAVKGMAWLLGIVGVFAVCILVAWMCNVNESPMASRLASSEAALKTPVKAAKSSLKTLTSAVKQPVVTVKEAISKISNTTLSTVQPASGKASAAAATVATMTQADKDRIEKEALEVIHGDYGNNPSRAEKLGSDYALVQARVNQLMHI